MAARKNRNRHRRRRGRFGFLYKLLSFLLIFAALLAGCVVFFRVNDVKVEGNSRYTAQEVEAASEIEMGANLFLINKPQTASKIMAKLPYVKKVTLVRRLPDVIELSVTESVAVAAIRDGTGAVWLLDSDAKLLEQGDDSLASGLPLVTGLTPVDPALGVRLAVGEEESIKLESLRSLLSALSDRDMAGNIWNFIDLTATNAIYFGYGEDLTVVVPMTGDFAQRVFSLQRVLETFQQRGETVAGTLDLTYGDDQARLLTERWLPGNETVQEEDQDGQPDPDVPDSGDGADSGDSEAAGEAQP
jgi:cell division protein FtsQ